MDSINKFVFGGGDLNKVVAFFVISALVVAKKKEVVGLLLCTIVARVDYVGVLRAAPTRKI